MNVVRTALILATLTLLGCSSTNPDVKTDRLAGVWECTQAVVNGRTLPANTVKILRLTLTSSRYKTEKGDEVLFDSTYRVDASKNPKTIDMVATEGDDAGKEAPGIYSIEGNTLRLCYTKPGKARPVSFESPAGSQVEFSEWQRHTP